jgi:hypothetical protein
MSTPPRTQKPRRPRFKVGQVVAIICREGGLAPNEEVIARVSDFGGVYYNLRGHDTAWLESELRPLTKKEAGR